MDRGQGGNLITELRRRERFRIHRLRMKSINNRKPMTSNTLDNRCPEVIHALIDDPRKIAVKLFRGATLERENKSLLKRIAKIVTAPPRITDEDYQRMKRLIYRVDKNPKERYENSLRKKAYNTYRKRLANATGAYSARDWEDDYKRQLELQRFTRQVNYSGQRKAASKKQYNGDNDNNGNGHGHGHANKLTSGLGLDHDDVYKHFYETGEYLDKPKIPTSSGSRPQSANKSNRPKSGGGYYYGAFSRRSKPKTEPVSPMKRLMKKNFTLSSSGFDKIEKERQSSYRDVYNVIDLGDAGKLIRGGNGIMTGNCKNNSISISKLKDKLNKKKKDDFNFNALGGGFEDIDGADDDDDDIYDGLEEFSFILGNDDEDEGLGVGNKGDKKAEIDKNDRQIELVSFQKTIKVIINNIEGNNSAASKSKFARKLNRYVKSSKEKQEYIVEGDLSCWYCYQEQTIVIAVTADLPKNDSSSLDEASASALLTQQTVTGGSSVTSLVENNHQNNLNNNNNNSDNSSNNNNDSSNSISNNNTAGGAPNDATTSASSSISIAGVIIAATSEKNKALNDMIETWRKNNDNLEFIQSEIELSLVDLAAKLNLNQSDIFVTDNDSEDSDAIKKIKLIAVEIMNCIEISIDEKVATLNINVAKDYQNDESYHSDDNDGEVDGDSNNAGHEQGREEEGDYNDDRKNSLIKGRDKRGEGKQKVTFSERIESFRSADNSFDKLHYLSHGNSHDDRALSLNPSAEEFDAFLFEKENIRSTKSELTVELHLDYNSDMPGLQGSNGALAADPSKVEAELIKFEVSVAVSGDSKSVKVFMVAKGSSKVPRKRRKKNSPLQSSGPQILNSGDLIEATFNLPTIAMYDIEFTNEFIAKVVENLCVVHGFDTGINIVVLKGELHLI